MLGMLGMHFDGFSQDPNDLENLGVRSDYAGGMESTSRIHCFQVQVNNTCHGEANLLLGLIAFP